MAVIHETTRQQKVAKQIQKDVADIFLKEGAAFVQGALVTVTIVRISPDLTFAKIFLSVFPYEKSKEMVSRVNDNKSQIRFALGKRVKHQLRIVPDLLFEEDNALEYIENLERLIKQ